MADGAGFEIRPRDSCPHCKSVTPLPPDFKFPEISCTACKTDSTVGAGAGAGSADLGSYNVWFCCHCHALLCGRDRGAHMKAHGEETGHAVTLCFDDLSFWCYSCDDYINQFHIPQVRSVFQEAHLFKFGTPASLPASVTDDSTREGVTLHMATTGEPGGQQASEVTGTLPSTTTAPQALPSSPSVVPYNMSSEQKDLLLRLAVRRNEAGEPVAFPFVDWVRKYCTSLGATNDALVGASVLPFHPKVNQNVGAMRMAVQEKIVTSNACDVEELRAIGCMLGMCIGDAIGAAVEFEPVRYGASDVTGMGDTVQGAFHLMPGQWTDDASMGLCLADSLLLNPGFDAGDCMCRFIAWWFAGYNNAFGCDTKRRRRTSVGLGGNISESFSRFVTDPAHNQLTTAGNDQTSGNGSVMRNAAPGIAFHRNMMEARRVAREQSLTTHQGKEAAGCCELLATIVVTAIHDAGVDDGDVPRARRILTQALNGFECKIADTVNYVARSEWEPSRDPERNWNWKNEEHRYAPGRSQRQPGYVGSYAMDGTTMALHCIWTTSSFQAAVLKAANMRGDADSVASITGQLAGAIYGAQTIPGEWRRVMQQWDFGGDVALRASLLYHQKDGQ